ncbi:MAG: CpaF family protein [Acidimicrobiia bacterium]
MSGPVPAAPAAAVDLGPLTALAGDPGVTDLLVNGDGSVWVERGGVLVATGRRLRRPEVELLIERIVTPLGLRVDRSSPVVDARLPDGSRVHAVVPPVAVDGPCLAVRRFSVRPLPLTAWCSEPVAELLAAAVTAGWNVIVAGGTGAGKTTLLNALAGCASPAERVVTVEDAAELRLPQPHVLRLEARPPNAEGVGEVALRDLVRSALRLRPDRLVVGEVRGGEALDLLQALNTGHAGCLATVHANGPADALRRLETLVLLAGVGLPLGAVRAQLAAAVDAVVHVTRATGGSRRVTAVAEVGAATAEADSVPVRLLADGERIVASARRGARRPAPLAAA